MNVVWWWNAPLKEEKGVMNWTADFLLLLCPRRARLQFFVDQALLSMSLNRNNPDPNPTEVVVVSHGV